MKQIHIISVDNECKELLFLLRRDFSGEPEVICVNMNTQGIQTDTFAFTEEKKHSIRYVSELKEYLYEPNTSLLKSGFYRSLALRYAVDKLHPDSHLYTSSRYIPDFPGRIFRVEAVSSFNKKDLKSLLHDIHQANISIRNFPGTVDHLRKQLKIREGGEIYLFATTLANGCRVLLKAVKKDCLLLIG